MKRTIDLDTYRKEMLKDPDFQKEYYKYDLKFEISEILLEARAWKGLTQEKLASLVKTKQAGIARAESGNHLPSLSFLDKIAKAIGTYLIVKFGFMEDNQITYTYKTPYVAPVNEHISSLWLSSAHVATVSPKVSKSNNFERQFVYAGGLV